jgi:hypothetical protein
MIKKRFNSVILKITGICLISLLSTQLNSAISQEESTQKKFVFDLEYQSNGFNVQIDVTGWPREKTFEKEPSLEGSDVVRGLLRTGTEEKDYIGFIWDKTAGKVYLDLNGNRDLTDDADGILISESRGQYQYFPNFPIDMQFGSVPVSFVVQIMMYGFDPPDCTFTVISGFKGQIELYGKKWQMSVSDNMNGKFDKADSLYLKTTDEKFNSRIQQTQLPVPKTIFFDGHSYNLSFEYKSGEGKPLLEVTFAEITLPMGQLNIEGKFIKYLTFESDSLLAVFDSPEKTISIPSGNYHPHNIFLDGGSAGLFQPRVRTSIWIKEININEGKISELNIGGPLNHSVKISRTGKLCKLDYELIDTGGISYESVSGRRDNAPKFAVYKGDKRVGSGSFEYG